MIKNKIEKVIILLLVLFFITGVSLFFDQSSEKDVNAAGWLSGWTRRKVLTVTSPETISNLQVKVTVAYDSDMQADFDDIRFTSSDGTTVLNYWLQSKTDSSTATIWFKASSLASGSNTLYMYYGNSGASSLSSGVNTFDFFDDFSGASLDTGKWDGSIALATLSGGIMSATGNGTNRYITSILHFTSPMEAVFKASLDTVQTDHFLGLMDWVGQEARWYAGGMDGAGGNAGMYLNGTRVLTSSAITGWGEYRIKWLSSSVAWYRDDVQQTGSPSSIYPSVSLPVMVRPYDNGRIWYFDYIYVKKAASSDPTASFGSEEIIDTTGPTIAQVTAVPSPTSDTTPNYTFSSNEAGTITYGGSCSSATTSATASNNTITFNALAAGTYSNCTIRVTDAASNQSNLLTVNTFTIDTTAPTIAQVTAVPSPTGDTTPNYTFSSNEAGTITYGGDCSSATTSAVSGNNTITFNTLSSATHSNCTIRVTDSATNQSNLLTVNTFTVDANAPTIAQVTAVPSPTEDVTPNYTFSSDEAGTITYGGDCSSATTSATASNNTITFNTLATGEHSNCTIRVIDAYSNQSNLLTVNTFTVAATAPIIAQVTAVPSPTSDTTPSYTFSSDEAGTITYGGDCSSATTSAASGNNTVTFNTLLAGTHSNCTIRVTDAYSNQSNLLTVNTFIINTGNSCWYCDHYYDESNVYQTGKSGYLDFKFTYGDGNPSATLSGYRIAVDATDLALANIDSQADVIVPNTTTWVSGGSVAPGTIVTNSQISVKSLPSAELKQLGYGTGTAKKTYYWWVKVKNSTDLESAWIPGSSFYAPKKHYPIVRIALDKTSIAPGTDVQYCAGADVSNEEDPCYTVCWKGTGVPVIDPENTDWKCSICYDSSNSPVSCSTLNDGNTFFTWKLPAGYTQGVDYTLTSGTLSSANPIIKLTNAATGFKMGLSVTGSACAAELESNIQAPLPTWKEVSPF